MNSLNISIIKLAYSATSLLCRGQDRKNIVDIARLLKLCQQSLQFNPTSVCLTYLYGAWHSVQHLCKVSRIESNVRKLMHKKISTEIHLFIKATIRCSSIEIRRRKSLKILKYSRKTNYRDREATRLIGFLFNENNNFQPP